MSKDKSPPSNGKGLPANLEAERYVLGSILLDGSTFSQASAVLKAEDYALEKHRRIFNRMVGLAERGIPIDRVTLANELIRYGELESCDGIGYLVSLDDGLPKIVNLESYFQIVRDKSVLRKIIYASQKSAAQAMAAEDDPRKILYGAEQELGNLSLELLSGEQVPNVRSIVQRVGASKILHPTRGIPTGFDQLDDHLYGLQPQCLYVIAAEPSQGKSTLCANIAVNVAKQGHAVGIFTMEMSKEQYILRMVCAEAGVPSKKIRKNECDEGEREKVTAAFNLILDLPIYIEDQGSLTITDFRTKARRLKTRHNCRAFAVDYLQIMDWASSRDGLKFQNEYAAFTFFSRAFKSIAKELDATVIEASQLTKPEGKRVGQRPTLSRLKDGSGGADPDAVVLLHRPDTYARHRPELRGKAELIVAKARDGEVGTVHAKFEGWRHRFIECEDEIPPDEEDVAR